MARERIYKPVICPYCGLEVGVATLRLHVVRYHPTEEQLEVRRRSAQAKKEKE